MKLGFVFTGQGSQRIGMGQDFHEKFPVARELFSQASDAIQVDLEKLCFQENDEINQTENTQPALLVTEVAIYESLKEKYKGQREIRISQGENEEEQVLLHLSGDFFAGHSLGEYSALVAADVIDFLDAVKIVRKRGLLMRSCIPAGEFRMAALIHDDLEKTNYSEILLSSGVEIANLNTKNQIVISGQKKTIGDVSEELRAQIEGITVIELNVQSPFHSSFMKAMEEEYKSYLLEFAQNFKYKNCTKVLSNFTGKRHEKGELIDNLVHQVSSSVKWVENMKGMLSLCDKIYEIGPNRVLGKFFVSLKNEVANGQDVKSIINLRSMEKAFPSS